MPKTYKKKIRHKASIADKPKFKRYLIGILLVAFVIFMVSGNYGLYKMWTLNREIRTLRDELGKAEEQRDRLKLEKEKLLNDYTYIEKIAREKLGMARPGEDVYKFIQNKKGNKNDKKD